MSKATYIGIKNSSNVIVPKKVKNVWVKVNGQLKQKVMPKGKINNIIKEFMQYTLKRIKLIWSKDLAADEGKNPYIDSNGNIFTIYNKDGGKIEEFSIENGITTRTVTPYNSHAFDTVIGYRDKYALYFNNTDTWTAIYATDFHENWILHNFYGRYNEGVYDVLVNENYLYVFTRTLEVANPSKKIFKCKVNNDCSKLEVIWEHNFGDYTISYTQGCVFSEDYIFLNKSGYHILKINKSNGEIVQEINNIDIHRMCIDKNYLYIFNKYSKKISFYDFNLNKIKEFDTNHDSDIFTVDDNGNFYVEMYVNGHVLRKYDNNGKEIVDYKLCDYSRSIFIYKNLICVFPLRSNRSIMTYEQY